MQRLGALLFLISWTMTGPGQGAEASAAASKVPARLERLNGVATLVVEGSPFLVTGAQCDIWRSTRQDAQTAQFFDAYRDMNATTVSVGIPWSKIEPIEDQYDFAFLDWFIRQAEFRGLKLIVNLFNSNVCGKIMEIGPDGPYPQYTPSYILDAPERYQRMVLLTDCQYAAGGPPMCPNDPDTLELERRLVVRVAGYLKERDTRRTVIMLQLNNEFYYQQWEGKRPKNETAVRCHCAYCDEKYAQGRFNNEGEFMFTSFADYARVISDAIAETYDIPLYLNSPWWPPYVVEIFLDRCPNVDLVGIDGVFSPNEPNMLSRSQVGRNIPFAAEDPTENAETRYNLDVLSYYSVAGQQGIGNLLWECGPPKTVLGDPEARRRYGAALYPLKNAQFPIARARGTEGFVGWYRLRDFSPEVTTDAFGNFVLKKQPGTVLRNDRLFVREGMNTRIVEDDHFDVTLGGLSLDISETVAGIFVQSAPSQLILATSSARVGIKGSNSIRAERGRFVRDQWQPDATFETKREGDVVVVEIKEPSVVCLNLRGATICPRRADYNLDDDLPRVNQKLGSDSNE